MKETSKEAGGLYILLNKKIGNQLSLAFQYSKNSANYKTNITVWHKRHLHTSSLVLRKLFSRSIHDSKPMISD